MSKRHPTRRAALAAGLFAPLAAHAQDAGATAEDRLLLRLALDATAADDGARAVAVDAILALRRRDTVGILIDLMMFHVELADRLADGLRRLTGAAIGPSWFDWMVWQEGRPDWPSLALYADFKSRLLALVDPAFGEFLRPGHPAAIRREEIVWGGVAKDGIPALTRPKFTSGASADWLAPAELVFGVEIAGDVRAYPQRIMDWHEMANDRVGGRAVALAYCTLCGSATLYDAQIGDRTFAFGSSGLLYRSNKLMYDVETGSLWTHFTGRPAVGPLVGSGLALRTLPIVVERWEQWRARHPATKVLSLDTGHRRDYEPGLPYGRYFTTPTLMFPAASDDTRLPPKEIVFIVELPTGARAWPVRAFGSGRAINDTVGGVEVVAVGDGRGETVRVYRRDGRTFAPGPTPGTLAADGAIWRIDEDALRGPGGGALARLPGRNAYWFAARGFLSAAFASGEAGLYVER